MTPKRKRQVAVEEKVVVNEVTEEEEEQEEEVITEPSEPKMQKPRFLDRFLKRLSDVVERID